MVTWVKRYSSWSLEELEEMTQAEFSVVCETLQEIIQAENGGEDK